jgi:HD-like signal output (HDOD) protein
VTDDADLLERLVSRLRGDCGVMILRKWGFASEFIEVALHAEDWQREAGNQPDYTDLVIIAQMHSYIGTPRMAEIPRIDTVPAFSKLALGDLGPGMSLRVLDEAEEEISDLQQVLQ